MSAPATASVDQGLIDPAEAGRRVLSYVERLPAEAVPLREALGRVLAADVVADEAVPGFDNSAMDGYAVRATDTAAARAGLPVRLALVDESRAGGPASRALAAGEAIRIATGAMMPRGADAVVTLEEATAGDGVVRIQSEVEAGRYVRREGDDVAVEQHILAQGTKLDAPALGVLASIGVGAPSCTRRPTLALLVTGDELAEPNEPLAPGAVRNANAYSIAAQAAEAGAEVVMRRTVEDDYGATVAAIRAALAPDVLVVCGGMSVGSHDHVRAALAALGVERVFFGVAIRPGKPTWFGLGERGDGDHRTLVFGLPGNPVSAMVTFHLFARPALAALAGAPPRNLTMPGIMAQSYAKAPGRAHAVRCRTEVRDGERYAHPLPAQGSHVLTSMLGADALALLDRGRGDVQAGEPVELEPLETPFTADWRGR